MNDKLTTTTAANIIARRRLPMKTIFAASVGNAVEWFDWTVYGTFAVIFSAQIFPTSGEGALTPTGALVSSFLVYAVAFFFRPLGGILIGRFADLRGRRAGMILTIALMAGGSLLLALTPTFSAVGWFAPVVLVIARVAQAIALGGEVSNAASYLAEIAPPEQRGRYSAFFYISTGSMVLLASLLGAFLTTVLPADDLNSWGWRAPFLFGALLGLLGFWLRRTMRESQLFEENQARAAAIKNPLLTTLREHPRSVLIIVALTMIGTLAYYTNFTALTTYVVGFYEADKSQVFWALSLATLIFVLLQYPIGVLSDRIGRRIPLMIMTGGYALLAVPMSLVAQNPNFTTMLLVFGVLLGLYALHAALNPAFMSEVFPTAVRAVGIGSWYNLTVATFGGTATLVLTSLGQVGLGGLFFWYVAAAGVFGFLVVLFVMPETRGKVLD